MFLLFTLKDFQFSFPPDSSYLSFSSVNTECSSNQSMNTDSSDDKIVVNHSDNNAISKWSCTSNVNAIIDQRVQYQEDLLLRPKDKMPLFMRRRSI